MARQLKVYGSIARRSGEMVLNERWHQQVRMFVAAPSKKAAAEAMGMSIGEFNHAGGETGNDEEIATAMAQPGKVFWRQINGGPEERVFHEWVAQDEVAAMRAAQVVRAAERKVEDARRAEERDAERQRRHEANQAAIMWAERLRSEFSIDCEPASNGKVDVIMDAEKLYARLVDIQGVLRDMGMEHLLVEE